MVRITDTHQVAIRATFYGPTTRKGARIKVETVGGCRWYAYGHKGHLSYDEAVLEFCEAQGWSGTLAAGQLDGATRVYTFVRGD